MNHFIFDDRILNHFAARQNSLFGRAVKAVEHQEGWLITLDAKSPKHLVGAFSSIMDEQNYLLGAAARISA
ncbi:hypothetical protein OSH93_25320, partial [Mycobacterium ulcerans]